MCYCCLQSRQRYKDMCTSVRECKCCHHSIITALTVCRRLKLDIHYQKWTTLYLTYSFPLHSNKSMLTRVPLSLIRGHITEFSECACELAVKGNIVRRHAYLRLHSSLYTQVMYSGVFEARRLQQRVGLQASF